MTSFFQSVMKLIEYALHQSFNHESLQRLAQKKSKVHLNIFIQIFVPYKFFKCGIVYEHSY